MNKLSFSSTVREGRAVVDCAIYSNPDGYRSQVFCEEHNLRSVLVRYWNSDTSLARWWERCALLAAVFSAGVYIVETYMESEETPLWSMTIEVIIASFFTVDYLLRLVMAENRLRYVLSGASVLDILCILPAGLMIALEKYRAEEQRAKQFIFFLQFLRVVRLIRILRGYRVVSVSRRGDPENLKKQIQILCYTVMALIFISAALLHLVEKYAAVLGDRNEEMAYFHDAVYFIVITLTTVGYGDITPNTVIGKALIMVFVIASVVIIPRETGKLSELMALTSQYAGSFKKGTLSHVVVCGYLDYSNLRAFLTEFFHQAHGNHNMVVVVISTAPPSKTVKLLFGDNGVFGHRCRFFEGSSLDAVDLERVQYRSALACFVLSNKLSTNPGLADCETTMRVLSVKNYAPSVPVLAQVLLPESKTDVITAGADHVVCLRELKMHILSVSSNVHGFSTLFCNLFRNEDFVFEEPDHWLTEYCHGISYEIYTIAFPVAFIDRCFADVAYFIYTEWGALLFGIQGSGGCFLNPTSPKGPYVIAHGDRGFLFATDSAVAERIETFGGDLHLDPTCGILAAPDNNEETLSQYDDEVRDETPKDFQVNLGKKPSVQLEEEPLPPLIPLGAPIRMDHDDTPGRMHERIIEQVPADMEGHVVLVAHNAPCVINFAQPLRTGSQRIRPIVALVSALPEAWVLRAVGRFPQVYFLLGTGKVASDFSRCKANKAFTVALLFSGTIGDTEMRYPDEYDRAGMGEEMIADYDSLLALTTLRSYLASQGASTNNPFTIIELVHKQNTRYIPPALDLDVPITDRNDYITPCYAGGKVYSDAVMDSLICQVFYNNELLNVLKLFLCGEAQPASQPKLAESDTNAGLPVWQSSRIFSMPVRYSFIGCSFSSVLGHLLMHEGVLPIGLLRAPNRSRQGFFTAGPGGSQPYVFLCPPLNTAIQKDDKLFVLSVHDEPVVTGVVANNITVGSVTTSSLPANPLTFKKPGDFTNI